MSRLPATLIIGATGMLGRPVARRLTGEGFPVRALVRDPQRARGVLPGECELVRGDLFDRRSLVAAMAGVEAVYINLSPPRSPRRPDPEQTGVPAIVDAAREAGVGRILKISFMGVTRSRGRWWQADRKVASDQAIIDSGLDYTILRPTWLMESIPLFRMGRRLIIPKLPPEPIYWIAGDDYARQIAAALRTDKAANRTYTIQGADALSFREAARRFGTAWRHGAMPVIEIPLWLLRPVAPILVDIRYLLDLLRVTLETNTGFEARESWDDLGEPSMAVEDYVRYMRKTGDVPHK
ncbi:MAG: SDR family oxidoreductase [Planctomycetota bacterium]|jgi:uncharacterized protein YbjT (DUF2867 family)